MGISLAHQRRSAGQRGLRFIVSLTQYQHMPQREPDVRINQQELPPTKNATRLVPRPVDVHIRRQLLNGHCNG